MRAVFFLPLVFLTLLAQTTPPATTPATQPAERVLNKEITTASGLHYHFTQLGTGPIPQTGDTLVVHGIGTFPDGKEFWNTRTEGKPWEYKYNVDRVIKGCTEIMQLMRQGDRVIVTMKPELAYGNRARTGIPANSTLVFDYEVMSIKPKGAAAAPATVPSR